MWETQQGSGDKNSQDEEAKLTANRFCLQQVRSFKSMGRQVWLAIPRLILGILPFLAKRGAGIAATLLSRIVFSDLFLDGLLYEDDGNDRYHPNNVKLRIGRVFRSRSHLNDVRGVNRSLQSLTACIPKQNLRTRTRVIISLLVVDFMSRMTCPTQLATHNSKQYLIASQLIIWRSVIALEFVWGYRNIWKWMEQLLASRLRLRAAMEKNVIIK